jgi:hypothetical protein
MAQAHPNRQDPALKNPNVEAQMAKDGQANDE